VTAERSALALWWQKLGSTELDALAQQLLRQNLSLAEARQRVVAARARRGIAHAERLPQVDAGAGYTRAGTGDESLNFVGPPPGRDVSVYSASLDAGWELDLWGRVARLVEAADADIEVTVEDYRDAAVSLLAELALAYVDATTLHERLATLQRSIDLQTETVRLAQSRFDAGTGARLDVEQSRRELEQTRARVPQLERDLAAAENRIAVLVGERPADGLVAAATPLTLPPGIGRGVPADLLERRADVRRAERALAAAVARIGAAEAERYPSISITGTVALRAMDLDTLASSDALAYSVGPSLTVPVFRGGLIESEVQLREADAEGARIAFERALLAAIGEVEDAAVGVARTRERAQALAAAAEAARRTATMAQQLYDAGLRDLLQVIDAQRAQVAVEDDLLVARQAAFAQTIGLYRALGGGFEPIGLDGALPGGGP
jgi:NodT family efflux transporter outer membrane factor (OMF) lipoprotein